MLIHWPLEVGTLRQVGNLRGHNGIDSIEMALVLKAVHYKALSLLAVGAGSHRGVGHNFLARIGDVEAFYNLSLMVYSLRLSPRSLGSASSSVAAACTLF